MMGLIKKYSLLVRLAEKKEKNTNINDRKIKIMSYLLDNITLEESIAIFNEVETSFKSIVTKKRNSIDKEKTMIEEWLDKKC